MSVKRHFPNLPGYFESGPFRLNLTKVQGRERITLIYKDELLATFDSGELVDLSEVAQGMALFLTREKIAALPPDED